MLLLMTEHAPATTATLVKMSCTPTYQWLLCLCAGDVYFFCGSRMQYCSCSFRWNLAGWNKALVLWSFVLTTALGVQRLMVQLVLQGLLPGELHGSSCNSMHTPAQLKPFLVPGLGRDLCHVLMCSLHCSKQTRNRQSTRPLALLLCVLEAPNWVSRLLRIQLMTGAAMAAPLSQGKRW